MWPWEHAIVGYVAYSLLYRAVYRDSPGGLDAFAAVFASVLPDLIDKPLAWEFGVFEGGYAVGHSIFFAVPLALAVGLLARERGHLRAGLAFGFGYLLHPLADVLDTYLREDIVLVELMLWPVTTTGGGGYDHGFLGSVEILLGGYLGEFLSGDPSTYFLAQIGLAFAALLLWLVDGAPVLRELVEWLADAAADAGSRLRG